jgi:hypothetical protein
MMSACAGICLTSLCWVLALIAGVPFGVLMGVSAKLDGDGWFGAGFMATSGIPFGLAMAWRGRRWRRERGRVEADLPADKLQVARLAASRGPVPADPEIRAAAARIATWLAEVVRRDRWTGAVGVSSAWLYPAAFAAELTEDWASGVGGRRFGRR